jgi:hypothetical protein
VGTGSREENAKRKEIKHFQAKHVPAKAGMGTGSREENAIKQRKKHFQAKHVPREGGDGHRFAPRKCEKTTRQSIFRAGGYRLIGKCSRA